jgi:hypothetical protein
MMSDPNPLKRPICKVLGHSDKVRELIDMGYVKILDKRACKFAAHDRAVEVIDVTKKGIKILNKVKNDE